MLYIHLLGHLRLFDSERTFEFSALPKTLPLMAYLLLHRESGPISRDKIAYTIWPEETEERAKANLRRHLYDLQQALPETAEDKPWFLRSRSTLQWNLRSDYWLDVAEFEKLSQSPDHLAKAATLYSGDLLPTVYDDWLEIYREGYRRQFFDNLDQLMSRSRAQKDYRQATAYAKQLLAYDALQEDVMRDYLLLRYEQGDRAGAMQAYQDFAALLERELEVSPLPETIAVYEAIRDDRVEELVGQDGRNKAGTSTGEPEKNVNKLPAQLNSFFGRTLDLITVQDLFLTQNPATRLLTLTGPGGSGKTRLALELAARVLPKQAVLFPDGIFFVDLSAVMEPEKVVETIADTLETKEQGGQTILEGLTEYLSARYLLLILDNFEQVIEAGSIIVDLLEAAPGLRVMITSRAALQLYGEHEYPVAPLPLPDRDHLPLTEDLLEFAAVSLFVARARAYKANFTLSKENAADVVTICSLLDGLPLAIELAAARIKLFSPKAMVAQLNSKLAFLSSKARNLPARQQTLRDTLDWSYQLLEKEEQRLFRRLALFRGSFTADAVARVALAPDGDWDHEAMTDLALNLLLALSEKSMIQVGQGEIETQPRFQMLSTVREYAQELLHQEQQPTTLSSRYALYFAGLAEAALDGLRGPEQVRWVMQIRDEVNNFQAALDVLSNGRMEERAQFPLSYIIGEDKFRKGHFVDAVPYFERSLEIANSVNDLRLTAKCWNGLADLYLQQGDNHQALKSAREAEKHARALVGRGQEADRERLELVTSVTLQGWALSRLGEFDEALPIAERAVALSETAEQPTTRLIAMNLLAYLYDEVGRYQDGAYYHQKAIAMARENKDQGWESALLNNLAESFKMMGNFTGALKVFEEAYQLSRSLGYRHIETLVLVNAGDAYLELGQFDEAETYFRRTLAEVGDKPPFFLAFCYALLGRVCAYKGQVEEGLPYAQEALSLAEELDNPEDMAYSWHALAELGARHEDGAVVVGRRPYTPPECFEKAAQYFQENGQDIERARLFVKWAGYETSVNQYEKAAALLDEARAVFSRYDLPLFLARVEKGLRMVNQ